MDLVQLFGGAIYKKETVGLFETYLVVMKLRIPKEGFDNNWLLPINYGKYK